MKHFVKLGQTYSVKNKAHKEIQDYARKVDYTLLLTDEEKKIFKSDFKKFVDDVNVRNKRCLDIELDSYKFQNYSLSVDGNFYMSIYEIKHERWPRE